MTKQEQVFWDIYELTITKAAQIQFVKQVVMGFSSLALTCTCGHCMREKINKTETKGIEIQSSQHLPQNTPRTSDLQVK